MNNNRECAAYFKEHRAYQRCLKKLWEKWRSYGKAAGCITLGETSEEERRAIGGIIGKNFYEQTIRFSFAEFEAGLQKTRYAPVDMKAVLEAYFGETLSTNQRIKEAAREKRKAFLDETGTYFLESAGRESWAFQWIQDLISQRKYGYQLLLGEYGKDAGQATAAVKNVGNALVKLEEIRAAGQEKPLAVFAAEISGNPHYFDRGTSAGQLLIHALCHREKAGYPESAFQWRRILSDYGIVPDNVSSMMHAFGLYLYTEKGRHPAYEAFCSFREPCVITMENLRGITGVQVMGDRVYVVENEMVFSYLVNRARNENVSLLCTSGQLRTAALALIPLILDSGAYVYYSGDIDPDGIGIADRLWQKFGERIRIWRMSSADYENSLSQEEIGENGISKLAHVKNPLLCKTAACVKEKGLAAYQENLLEDLLDDICFSS